MACADAMYGGEKKAMQGKWNDVKEDKMNGDTGAVTEMIQAVAILVIV